MIEATWITFAFGLGLVARYVGLPPLIGYLGAGFVLAAFDNQLGITRQDSEILSQQAHLGVLLLMFTVGLKLKPSSLARPEVAGVSLLHFVLSSGLLLPPILLLLDVSWQEGLMLSVALAFSSTVLAAKILEGRRELRSFHGRVAIGVLIVQDLIALVVMSLASGQAPSPWALLLFLLPLLRPLLYRLLDNSGHEELLILLGLLLALVVGGQGFEAVGLSSELGALVFGAMLAKHPRAAELSDSLWSVKEVFLVGFFLQIGIGGLPDVHALWVAAMLSLLLPFKTLLFFFLFLAFRLRSRSAFLSAVTLTHYSEFGLIVTSALMPQWLVPLAITLAFSFILSAPFNRVAARLYDRLASRLIPLERNIRHPDEQPVSLGAAQILVMGMGRSGRAAYDYLHEKGYRLVSLDSDQEKVERATREGRNILYADAEDQTFWMGLEMNQTEAVILTMGDAEAKVIACQKLREKGFDGLVVSHALYEDVARQVEAAGADHTYLTMTEAGIGLAQSVVEQLQAPKRREGSGPEQGLRRDRFE